MPADTAVLRKFQFLRPLDDSNLGKLAQQVEETRYPADATIFPDGVVGDKFYLLNRGRVQIVKATPDGEVVLNALQPGDSFGEMSLLDGEPRSASARAADDVSVVEIPKDVFTSLIRQFPVLVYFTALENAQRLRRSDSELIKELRARNQDLQQLYETSLDITRHLDLGRALSAIAERAQNLLDCTGSEMHLYDAARQMLVAPFSHRQLRPGEGTTGQAFASGEAVFANAATTRGGEGKFQVSARCELAAPVSIGENKLGTLTVFRPGSATPFSPQDAQLLRLLANQAAIAIENARLFGLSVEKGRLDGELKAAREVQRSLIPTRAPRVSGYQLHGLWRPAREVAGDFYDFVPLGKGRLGLVIGDVSDKGAAAALFMAISRSVVRASALSEPDAALAIERANRLLAADASNGMFVTLFYGILETRSKRMTFVNAGHNPPMLLRAASGRLERVSRHGLALAVDPAAKWTAHSLEFGENDLFLLYTDGVTEAFSEKGEPFGEARLARILKSCLGESAVGVVNAVDREVREFMGGRHLEDDVTLVAVRPHA